jgi:hypothetical protein
LARHKAARHPLGELPHRGGPSRDWIKPRVSKTATFTVIGYEEPGPGDIEALLVAEPFGVDKAMLEVLAPLRQGEAVKGRVTVAPELRCGCATSAETGTD